jgi:hypothetical protein
MQFDRHIPTYQGTAAAIRLELLFSWERQHVPPKVWYLSTKLYGAICQTTVPYTSYGILMWHHYSEGMQCTVYWPLQGNVASTQYVPMMSPIWRLQTD